MSEAAPSTVAECYEPHRVEGAGDSDSLIFDPRTYLIPVSRAQFRALKLRWIFVPCLDAPVLRFPIETAGRAAVLQSLIEEQRSRYYRTADPVKRISFGTRGRRFHLLRVNLATGYSWPGNDPRVVLEFADAH